MKNVKIIWNVQMNLSISHCNELNFRLQCQNELIHNLFNHIKSFENKILLWKIQLNNINTIHFL